MQEAHPRTHELEQDPLLQKNLQIKSQLIWLQESSRQLLPHPVAPQLPERKKNQEHDAPGVSN